MEDHRTTANSLFTKQATVGAWKDGLFSCFRYGCCHAHLCLSCWCAPSEYAFYRALPVNQRVLLSLINCFPSFSCLGSSYDQNSFVMVRGTRVGSTGRSHISNSTLAGYSLLCHESSTILSLHVFVPRIWKSGIPRHGISGCSRSERSNWCDYPRRSDAKSTNALWNLYSHYYLSH
jgi:hypothetical protein